MKPIEDGGPAFPTIPSGYTAQKGFGEWNLEATDDSLPVGMSLRDYFAAQALPLTEYACDASETTGCNAVAHAKAAYAIADAMIAERTKAGEES